MCYLTLKYRTFPYFMGEYKDGQYLCKSRDKINFLSFLSIFHFYCVNCHLFFSEGRIQRGNKMCVYTQELVEGIEDGAPGLSCLPSYCLSKMSCAAVDMKPINTLQDQTDHPLQTQRLVILKCSWLNEAHWGARERMWVQRPKCR